MKKTVLRFGLFGAITICVLFVLALSLGSGLDYSAQEIIGYSSMIISLSFVFFGIKHFRDKENNGVVTFKQALKIGLLISLLTALAFGVLDTLYTQLVNPDFATEYYTDYIKKLEETVPAEELEAAVATAEIQKELFSNPVMSFLLMAVTVFVIGFIISLLSSLVLQRKQP
ncbi:DUF4199 domain-containing protein [Spongiivirga citrea]|uniref:DUF4199 family protein n=1 Tax=Spongiivirga citrea TaxID=1481457 RepID=A0A6M0CRA7_9FLAO|nr:DUF4199 domain-containing protein [Spongiivirga citrea]NER18047.1 DUF4199 family protein [Spongiivirga citrea]